jgi:hypothetical protein
MTARRQTKPRAAVDNLLSDDRGDGAHRKIRKVPDGFFEGPLKDLTMRRSFEPNTPRHPTKPGYFVPLPRLTQYRCFVERMKICP